MAQLGGKLIKGTALLTGATLGTLFYSYHKDSRAAVHKYLYLPLIRQFYDGEESHQLAIRLAQYGLSPIDKVADDDCLSINLFGKRVQNVVGLAAGFDKNAQVVDQMFNMGFGMVEVGSITPEPQEGNVKPRVFRLENQESVINRYGFNSDGAKSVLMNIKSRYGYHNYDSNQNKSLFDGKILGINLGKNKKSDQESNQDYIDGVKMFSPYADYIVINISSPNTPGLRNLQQKETLLKLIKEVKSQLQKSEHQPALVLKVAPDLNDQDIVDISQIIIDQKVDGLIVSNTTIQRPSGTSLQESGGLSGKLLKPIALNAVQKFYKATKGKVTIIGCGGISSGQDALDYIQNGASCIQLYSALIYQGPGLVREIKDFLAEECKKRGVKSISELVGKNL